VAATSGRPLNHVCTWVRHEPPAGRSVGGVLTALRVVAAAAAVAAAIPLPVPRPWNDKAVQIAASYFFPVVVAAGHSFMKEGGEYVFMAGLFN
jgi:hypothetical protein